MAMKAGATNRAPRGTKNLIKAFFDAADGIPEGQRDGVVKAAMSGIRDELKAVREKAKAAKAKTRVSAAKAPKKSALAKMAAKMGDAAKPAGRKVRAKSAQPSIMPEETAEV
jgi:hypothetical protein